jgi:hypothetical protein
MKFNINNKVKIKLTEYGEIILKKENLKRYIYNYNIETNILNLEL